MKFLICIPVELTIKSTKRSEIKSAGKAHLLKMARDPAAAAQMCRDMVNQDNFLVRAYEETKGEREARLAGEADAAREEGASGVG